MYYSYDRSVKLNAEMEAEEEALRQNLFYLFASPCEQNKIK